MAVFHHYAYAETPPDPHVIGEDLWAFCYRAIGGTAPL